jgi:hypothetical protein
VELEGACKFGSVVKPDRAPGLLPFSEDDLSNSGQQGQMAPTQPPVISSCIYRVESRSSRRLGFGPNWTCWSLLAGLEGGAGVWPLGSSERVAPLPLGWPAFFAVSLSLSLSLLRRSPTGGLLLAPLSLFFFRPSLSRSLLPLCVSFFHPFSIAPMLRVSSLTDL